MKTSTKIILAVAIIVIVAAVAFFILKKPKGDNATMPLITPADPNTPDKVKPEFPLNVGSTGTNVRRLQAALNWIKPEDPVEIDGNFGSMTRVKLLTTVASTLSYLPMPEASLNKIIVMGNAKKLGTS